MKKILSVVLIVVVCAALVLTAGCADTAGKNSVGKNTSSNNTVSNNAVSNNAVSDNTASNNASSVAVENIYGSAELTNNQVAVFQKSGEITLYTDEAQIAEGKHNEALKAELEWYKEHYGLTIKYVYQASNGNERTNFIIDLGKGKAPDYIPLDYGSRDWIQLASFGTVYSVEDLKEMGVEGLDHPEFEKYKNIKDRFRLDGECYSPVAVSCDPVVVCVNTDLFKQYSVKSPVQYYKEGNWNMDTYIECCKELSRDVSGGTKIWGSFASNNSWYMVALGTKTVKWKSNNELVYAVEDLDTFNNLKIVDNLYSQGYSPVSKLYTQEQPFKAGRMGMYICTATELAQMAPDMSFKWEIIPMPSAQTTPAACCPAKLPVRVLSLPPKMRRALSIT